MHASVACDHPQSDKGPSHVWTRAAQKRGRSIMSPPTDHHSWMQLPRNHRKGAAMRSLPALETQLTGERSSAEDAGKLERQASRGAAWARDLLQICGTKHPMCTKHPRCRLGPCAAVARPAAVCACRSSSSKGRNTLARPRSARRQAHADCAVRDAHQQERGHGTARAEKCRRGPGLDMGWARMIALRLCSLRRSSRCKRRKHSYSHIFGGLDTRTSSIPQLCPRCSRQLIISGWKHAAPTSSAFLSSCERASTQQKKIDFREQICTQLQKDGYSRERAGHTCTLSCRRECSAYVSDMIV